MAGGAAWDWQVSPALRPAPSSRSGVRESGGASLGLLLRRHPCQASPFPPQAALLPPPGLSWAVSDATSPLPPASCWQICSFQDNSQGPRECCTVSLFLPVCQGVSSFGPQRPNQTSALSDRLECLCPGSLAEPPPLGSLPGFLCPALGSLCDPGWDSFTWPQ